jgi:hypothetical protein
VLCYNSGATTKHHFFLTTGLKKRCFTSIACAIATTKQQRHYNAELKTVASAKTLGR